MDFRPTTGRVREFIYGWLGEWVVDAEILDLFAETGSLGIEGLSRGAKHVLFVERSPAQLALLRKNLELCGFSGRGDIMKSDVFGAMDRLSGKPLRFDCILADPPFKASFRGCILQKVWETHLLKPSGWLILEHEQHDADPGKHKLERFEQRKFGHCIVSIYRECIEGSS